MENIMNAQSLDPILRLNTVLDRTGLSRATLYRKIRAGTFPKQIRIATSGKGWQESAVQDWQRNPMFWSANDTSPS
ncbi:helix-turn-helix transcriptional regulator [Sphingobium chungbukense]